MGPTWGPSGGRQDPGGPPVGPMNFAIWFQVHTDFAHNIVWWLVGKMYALLDWSTQNSAIDYLALMKPAGNIQYNLEI